jgi:hypothetical protein
MPSFIQIIPISAPLPEGWEGTPDEFREEIFSTLSFQASGAFLTGQIGGATPTEDVGLFISGQDLFTWDADTSTYKAINTDLIGSLRPYLGATVPSNGLYLLCDGGEYLKTDYPALYAIIGDVYKRGTDSADNFRVPDMRGRTVFGAGVGDYDAKQDGIPGRMAELTLNEYGGTEWVLRKATKHPQQPPSNNNPGDSQFLSGVTHATLYSRAIPPHVVVNWLVRAK